MGGFDDWLCHSGTFGMKWGRRRYQNKDGSLTPEGKEHYKEMYKAANKAGRKNSIEGVRGAGAYMAKKNDAIRKAAGERLTELKYSKNEAAHDLSKKQKKLDNFVERKYSKVFGTDRHLDAEVDWAGYKENLGKLQNKYANKKVVKNERESLERYKAVSSLFDAEATKVANELLGEYADKPIKTLGKSLGNYKSARTIVKAALEAAADDALKSLAFYYRDS